MLRGATQSQRKAVRLAALPLFVSAMMLGGLILSLTSPATSAKAIDFADSSFKAQWERSDKPVQDSTTVRSWVWGPAFSEGKNEDYKESPGGKRLVQYFDKARMEIINPNADHNGKYFVTNGLLVEDMIAGRLQVGDKDFVPNPQGPSQVQVAGDPGNPVALTYASFRPVASIDGGNRTGDLTGKTITSILSKDGVVSQNPGVADYKVKNAYYDETLGHNIPDVFWNFLNEQGQIYVNGSLSNGQILDWLVADGLPLTEAYWSRAIVNGQEKDVLVQMFERRVLTFTPSNAADWQVEMGNVGQHYYKWRYNTSAAPATTPSAPATGTTTAPATGTTAAPTTPVPTTPVPTTPVPTTPPATTVVPTTAPPPVAPPPPSVSVPPASGSWAAARQVQAVAKPAIAVSPANGAVWVVGENKGAGGIFASSSASNYQQVYNVRPNGNGGEKVSATVDGHGNLHVFWQEGTSTGLHTFYARLGADGKQTWTRDMGNELVGGRACGLPSVYYNAQTNHLYLTQEEQPNTVGFWESADEGYTWTNHQVVGGGNGTQTNPKVVSDASGNVHITWSSLVANGAADLYGADRIGGSWTGAYNITKYNGSWNVGSASLSVGANGDAYLAWGSPAPGAVGVGFARYDAASKKWQARQDNISRTVAGFGGFTGISVAVTSNGTLWIVFNLDNQSNSGASGAYFFTSSDNGANWTGISSMFHMINASTNNVVTYGGNIYYVGAFNRTTWTTYRGQ